MKHSLIILVVLLQGCCLFTPCEETVENHDNGSKYTPIHRARAELNTALKLQPAKSIQKSGKIYSYNDLLFVGEKRKGFHVFDNSNPKNPLKTSFIQVEGSTDIAFRNSVFYINQGTDLLAVKYNGSSKTLDLIKRIKNTFPELVSPDGFTAKNIPENHVVIDWKLK